MKNVLANAASRGFSDLAGTEIAGTLPVREKTLNAAANDALPRKSRIQQIDVRVKPENRVQVGMKVTVGPFSKWFRPEFLLARQLRELDSPMVLLTAISAEYSALLWLVDLFAKELLPPGVQVRGSEIAVNLALIPQVEPYREYIRYIERIDLLTEEGEIRIGFDVRVGNGKTEDGRRETE